MRELLHKKTKCCGYLLAVAMTMLFSLSASAEETADFTDETTGLGFYIIDEDALTVGVANDASATGTEIEIPETVESDGVTYTVTAIGDSAFRANTTVTSISMPDCITTIGYRAFYGCTALVTMNIPTGLTTLNSSGQQFYNCKKWTGADGTGEITIPESVTSIPTTCFYYCSGLTSITLSDNITSIGKQSFYYCSALVTMNIPSKLTSIGDSAFYYCKKWTGADGTGEITIPSGVSFSSLTSQLAVFHNCLSIKIINIEGVMKTYPRAFCYNCTSLVEFNLAYPESLTLNVGNTSSSTATKYYQFYGCSSLKSIHLPTGTGCTWLPCGMFSGCKALTTITGGDYIVGIGYSGSSSTASEGAFYNCTSLTSSSWSRLTDGKLTSIGSHTFNGCTALDSINIENVTGKIWDYAFSGCKVLKDVTFNDSLVTHIYENAFYNCSTFSVVHMPESLESIRTKAFYQCANIDTIYLSSALTGVEGYGLNFNSGTKEVWVYAPMQAVPTRKDGATTAIWNSNTLNYGILVVPSEDLKSEYQSSTYWNFDSIYVDPGIVSDDRTNEERIEDDGYWHEVCVGVDTVYTGTYGSYNYYYFVSPEYYIDDNGDTITYEYPLYAMFEGNVIIATQSNIFSNYYLTKSVTPIGETTSSRCVFQVDSANQWFFFKHSVVSNDSLYTYTCSLFDPEELPNLKSSSPAVGEKLAYTTSGWAVSLTFNIDVSISTATLASGSYSETFDEINQTSKTSAAFYVGDIIYNWLDNGYVQPGDEVTLTLTGLCSNYDNSILYDADTTDNVAGDGVMVLSYIIPEKPMSLTEDKILADTIFKSFWAKGDEDGIMTMTFDKDLYTGDNENYIPSARLSFGNPVNTDYYNTDDESNTETIPVTVSGNTLTIDLTGTPRSLVAMGSKTLNVVDDMGSEIADSLRIMALKVSNIYDTDGTPCYTGLSSNVGSFTYNFDYELLPNTWEISPEDGSDLTDTEYLTITVNDPATVSLSSIDFTYTTTDTYEDVTVSYTADDITSSYNADTDIQTYKVSVADFNTAANIKATLNVDSLVGDYTNNTYNTETSTITATYNEKIILVSPSESEISEGIEYLSGSDSLILKSIYTDEEIGYMYFEIVCTEGQLEGETVKTRSELIYSNGQWSQEYVNNVYLLEGCTYQINVYLYSSESDFIAGNDYVDYASFGSITGAYSPSWSSVMLETIEGFDGDWTNEDGSEMDVYDCPSEDEGWILTFVFSDKVTINSDLAYLIDAAGSSYVALESIEPGDDYEEVTDDDGNVTLYSSNWYLKLPYEYYCEESGNMQIALTVTAIDMEGLYVYNELYAEETYCSESHVLIYFNLMYNIPEFTITPEDGSSMDCITSIIVEYENGIMFSWNSNIFTIYDSEGNSTELNVNDLKYQQSDDATQLTIYLPEALTTPGEYSILFPEDLFAMDELSNAFNNKEQGVSFTIEDDKLTQLYASVTEETSSTTNVGDGLFQIPESAVTTLQEAYTEATSENVYAEDNEETYSTLSDAYQTYLNAMGQPEDGKRIYITSESYDGVLTMAHNDEGYFLKAKDVSANYAQAFTFTSTEDANTYLISITDSTLTEQYLALTDGELSLVSSSDEATPLTVIANTGTDGVWYLYDETSESYAGGNCTFGYADQQTVELKLTSASEYYGTLTLPFTASIPTGLTVYYLSSLGSTTDDVTTLVYEEQTSLVANTPYVVFADGGMELSFTDYGQAAQDLYEHTYMTGTLAEMSAVEGSYVLQYHSSYGLAFYIVEDTKPTVTANRAYVNQIDDASGINIRTCLLPTDENDITEVNAVDIQAENEEVDVYSLSGVLIHKGVEVSQATNGLSKGIYIVNGRKYTVK